MLDITPSALCDYYLVLAGPPSDPVSAHGVRPWLIHRVFLFDPKALVDTLTPSGIKIGVATSVRRAMWDAAEIYPNSRNALLTLNDDQRKSLALFGAPSV